MTPVDRNRKVVVVTGASAGIGAALARELARQGRNLVLTARRGDRLDGLAAELRTTGVDVLSVPVDLADADAPRTIIGSTVAHFGGLDVLVNNAGFGLPTLFSEAEPSDLRKQLMVNFVAPLLLAREATPHLVARHGTIINVGSAITYVANSGLGAYGATKAGLGYWNDAYRRELRHKGVNVCLVEPGPVKTEFFDALMTYAPASGEYNPLLDAPLPWMTAEVNDVARRIARLIDRPRRRLRVRRRIVWPFRMLGGLFHLWPWLGDVALSSVVSHFDKAGDLNRRQRGGSLGDAQPTD